MKMQTPLEDTLYDRAIREHGNRPTLPGQAATHASQYRVFKTCMFALISLSLTGGYFGQTAHADSQASANYRIDWDVVDAGGIAMSSTNYTVNDSPAQPSPLGDSSSASYRLTAGFYAAPDTDTDRIRDFMDNCTLDPNSSQLDTDGDGYGNFCDPDLDNSGSVNFIDYSQLTAAFLSTPASTNWNPDADLNGDNVVNFIDVARFQLFFLGSPGPSGLN